MCVPFFSPLQFLCLLGAPGQSPHWFEVTLSQSLAERKTRSTAMSWIGCLGKIYYLFWTCFIRNKMGHYSIPHMTGTWKACPRIANVKPTVAQFDNFSRKGSLYPWPLIPEAWRPAHSLYPRSAPNPQINTITAIPEVPKPDWSSESPENLSQHTIQGPIISDSLKRLNQNRRGGSRVVMAHKLPPYLRADRPDW